MAMRMSAHARADFDYTFLRTWLHGYMHVPTHAYAYAHVYAHVICSAVTPLWPVSFCATITAPCQSSPLLEHDAVEMSIA